jgi:hypothetical protein
MIRAVTVILAAALAAVALDACGQSSEASSEASAPPIHIRRYSYGDLTKSQAAAFARTVNIAPRDVPGFTIASSEATQGGAEPRLESAMLACTGIMSGHSELAQAGSREFERSEASGDYGVSSSVSIARTPAIAKTGLTAANKEDARRCMAQRLAQDVERKPNGGSNVRSLSASPEKALATGTSGGVVLRVLADVAIGGKPTPLQLDFYGFVCGQAQIGLFTTSLSGQFPARTRQQLLALLRSRAQTSGQCAAGSAGAST